MVVTAAEMEKACLKAFPKADVVVMAAAVSDFRFKDPKGRKAAKRAFGAALPIERTTDILAGLHRSIILRAMSPLARSGGVSDEFTFTGGVANNAAAVDALKGLVRENYGERVLNISPNSIYTGALGAALFARRDAAARAALEVAA